jgi:hypothetical protein
MCHLKWSGDERVDNLCGCNYIQHPFKKYVEHFKKTPPTGALSAAMVIGDEHTVSPQRGRIRKLAAESLEKKVKWMKEDAFKKMGGKD